jgi:hypothetical protein
MRFVFCSILHVEGFVKAEQMLSTAIQTFNVELDSLFNDMQLPPTEAFKALQRDVQETKAKRNDLHLENM